MAISNFINQAGGNLARPTKFTAYFNHPVLDFIPFQDMDILCKTAGIPDTTMEPIEIKIKGHNLKIPGRVNQLQEITATFYLDETHSLRKLFYDWQALADNRFNSKLTGTAAAMAQSNNAFGGITLVAKDFYESPANLMAYIFEDVYPISVQGVEFNTAGTNEVLEFTVTFAFYRFHQSSQYAAISDAVDNNDEYLDN